MKGSAYPAVAAVQLSPRMFCHAENLDRLEALCAEAAAGGARLVVTPEMATTGYMYRSRAEIAPFVEPLPGPTSEQFSALARRSGAWFVIGMPEVEPATGHYYNAAALVGPAGLAGVYRKVHLHANDYLWAVEGAGGFPVFDTPLGRIGIQICQDGAYFEGARILALQGAELIAFPTNWLGNGASDTWRARARENGVWWVTANRYDEERGARFSGCSAICDPDGEIAAVAPRTGDAVVQAARGPLPARRLPAERRPELYRDLLQNTYRWGAGASVALPPGGAATVAVVQGEPPPAGVEALEWVEKQAAAACAAAYCEGPATGLVVFPELTLSGGRAAEAAYDGTGVLAAVGRLARVADLLQTHLVVGLLESAGPARYSTLLLIGPGGLRLSYRQAHPTPDSGVSPGDTGFVVADLPFGRVGLLTGRDLEFPESTRLLARAGADLIAVAAACNPGQDWLWRVRAWRNDVALAVANWSPGGQSLICNKLRADVRAAPAGAAILAQPVSFDDDSPQRRKETLRHLRASWYGGLVAGEIGGGIST